MQEFVICRLGLTVDDMIEDVLHMALGVVVQLVLGQTLMHHVPSQDGRFLGEIPNFGYSVCRRLHVVTNLFEMRLQLLMPRLRVLLQKHPGFAGASLCKHEALVGQIQHGFTGKATSGLSNRLDNLPCLRGFVKDDTPRLLRNILSLLDMRLHDGPGVLRLILHNLPAGNALVLDMLADLGCRRLQMRLGESPRVGGCVACQHPSELAEHLERVQIVHEEFTHFVHVLHILADVFGIDAIK